jgi:hypothetical protein
MHMLGRPTQLSLVSIDKQPRLPEVLPPTLCGRAGDRAPAVNAGLAPWWVIVAVCDYERM